MSDAKKIEACPLGCNGEVVAHQYVIEGAVYCKECRITICCRNTPRKDDGLKKAIAIWNARKPRELDEGKLIRLLYRIDNNFLSEDELEIMLRSMDADELATRVSLAKAIKHHYTAGLLWEETGDEN
jgi:hypothetical protein